MASRTRRSHGSTASRYSIKHEQGGVFRTEPKTPATLQFVATQLGSAVVGRSKWSPAYAYIEGIDPYTAGMQAEIAANCQGRTPQQYIVLARLARKRQVEWDQRVVAVVDADPSMEKRGGTTVRKFGLEAIRGYDGIAFSLIVPEATGPVFMRPGTELTLQTAIAPILLRGEIEPVGITPQAAVMASLVQQENFAPSQLMRSFGQNR